MHATVFSSSFLIAICVRECLGTFSTAHPVPEPPEVLSLWNQTALQLLLEHHPLDPKRRSLPQLGGSTSNTPSSNHTHVTRTIHIPIVIQLSGEFGNHLGKIAAGVGVAALLHSYNHPDSPYQFNTTIQIRKQPHTTKGETALQMFQRCFPHLAHLADTENEYGGTVDDSNRRPIAELYPGINSNRGTEVDAAIAQIVQDAIQAFETSRPLEESNETTTFTAPFTLYSNHMAAFFDVYMDRFYDLYRELFFMRNDTADCTCHGDDDAPFPDEIVFYHRGFLAEMPKNALRLGFEEIAPAPLVAYLTETLQYRPLEEHRRVAILSRFVGAPPQRFLEALTEVGFAVRVIGRESNTTINATTPHNAVSSILHDFCFLRHAQTELIGPIHSTFFQWASMLRVATPSLRVTAYAMESQRLWAESSRNATAANDSSTRQHYYYVNDEADAATNRSSLWEERNFVFPLFPSMVEATPVLNSSSTIPP